MELVLALVDAAVARHKRTDFILSLLDGLREFTAEVSDVTFRQIREHLGVYEQYLLCRITHFTMF